MEARAHAAHEEAVSREDGHAVADRQRQRPRVTASAAAAVAAAAVIVVTRRGGRRHATAASRRVIFALAARLDGHGHDVLQ